MPSALTGPQPPNDDVWRSWTIAVARVSGVCVGCSADVGSAPPPTRVRCPHSDSAMSTTSFWHSPSPGTSLPSAPPLRSAQAPLNGLFVGHKANLAFSPADFLLQNDDLFSMSWHTSTGPAWPVLRSLAAPGLADALRLLASMGWRLPLALRPASPTTFYPCGLAHPAPNALCVCRRALEGLSEATPSIRRRAMQARNLRGSPPPAPRPRCDAASPKRLPLLEPCPFG